MKVIDGAVSAGVATVLEDIILPAEVPTCVVGMTKLSPEIGTVDETRKKPTPLSKVTLLAELVLTSTTDRFELLVDGVTVARIELRAVTVEVLLAVRAMVTVQSVGFSTVTV